MVDEIYEQVRDILTKAALAGTAEKTVLKIALGDNVLFHVFRSRWYPGKIGIYKEPRFSGVYWTPGDGNLRDVIQEVLSE